MFGLNSDHSVSGTATAIINKPIEDVFNFIGVGFFENYPRWSPEVIECVLLTEPPLQLNSIVRQVRVDHGQRSESTFKVTSFEPKRYLIFEGISNAYRCSFDFQTASLDTQTKITFTFELLELELFMIPFEKLIRAAIREGAARTVRNLKRLVES